MADPEVSLLLHCAAWHGLRQEHVQVELSERFNRQTDADLERHIEELWTQRVAKEPWLFNGAKFRLYSFCLVSPTNLSSSAPKTLALRDKPENQTPDELSSVSDGNGARPLLTLRLGLTCYKDYLGTNWSCSVEDLYRRGEAKFSDRLALLAQPLGVGAIMCTADGRVVLIRRSQKVAEAAGLLDIPGGHPEPKVVCERLGEGGCDEQIGMTLMQQSPEAVVDELFSSVCAEIRDEVNVPLSSLGEPVLMGVALNHTSACRPSAEFYVSCLLTSDEVQELYCKGGAEASESTEVIFLSTAEMLQLDSSSPLWSQLCPSAKGAMLLFQMVKPDGGANTQTEMVPP